MTVTIATLPADRESTYRHLEFVVTSDDADIERMKALIAVDGTDLEKPIIQDPDLGTTNQFTFDIHRILAGRVTFDLQTVNAGIWLTCSNSGLAYTVKFTELLDSSAGLIDGDDDTSASQRVNNATWQHEDTDQDIATVYQAVANRPTLTTAPGKKLVGASESEFERYFMGNTVAMTVKMQIKTFDVNGNANGTFETVPTANSFDLADWGAGPGNLNALTLAVGSQPVIGAADFTYTTQLIITAGGSGETFAINNYTVDHKCFKNETRFHFENSLGATDSITFTGRHAEGMKMRAKDFTQYLESGFAVQDRGRTELGIEAFEKFSVWSRILKKTEARWLKELYHSPAVFIQNSDGNYVPIIIINKNGWKIDSAKPANQLKIDYIKANNLIIQTN